MVQIFTLDAPSKKTAFFCFFLRVKSIDAKALGYKPEVGGEKGGVGDGRR